MVKLICLCRRRPDISHQRYAELLLDGHVPIALRHHSTLRRYTVNIVEQSPPDLAALDSIGVLSFDSCLPERQDARGVPHAYALPAIPAAGLAWFRS
jgi:hypothetical protein